MPFVPPAPQAATGGSGSDFPVLYTHTPAATRTSRIGRGDFQPGPDGQTTMASAAKASLLASDSGTISGVQSQLVAAGYLRSGNYVPGFADQATLDAYDDLLRDSGMRLAAGKQLTVDEVLDQRTKAVLASGQQPGGNNHATEIRYTDPTSAHALLYQAMRSRLGRAPTPGEISSFTKALNAAESGNPVESQTDGQGATTTSGGLDTGQFADDFVMQNNGAAAGAHVVATDYYSAALNLIGVR